MVVQSVKRTAEADHPHGRAALLGGVWPALFKRTVASLPWTDYLTGRYWSGTFPTS
jgi:hypothetical protein